MTFIFDPWSGCVDVYDDAVPHDDYLEALDLLADLLADERDRLDEEADLADEYLAAVGNP